MSKKFIFCFLFLLLSLATFGQQWTDHLNMSSATFAGKLEGRLFAGNSAGLFSYHLEDYLLEKISKANLLNDVDITSAKAVDDLLFVGYQNGNIDIVSNSGVLNIPDIKLSNISSSKRVNNFMLSGNRLYCCTDFGIVVVNIDRREVEDTYYIGSATENFKVNALVVSQNSYYAATDKGLYRGDKDSGSLAFYESWTNIGGDALTYKDVVLSNDNVVAFRNDNNASVAIRLLINNVWTYVGSVYNFVNAVEGTDGIYIAYSTGVNKLTEESKLVTLFSQYRFQGEASVAGPAIGQLAIDTKAQRLIIGDLNYGMVYCNYQGEGIHVSPNAPRSNNCFRLAANAKGVYVAAGGLNSAWNNLLRPLEFSYFSDGSWSSTVRETQENYIDAINIAIDPSATDSVYFSCWGSGVFNVIGDAKGTHYNQYNSLLQNIAGLDPVYVRVGGLCYDNQSNLFMSNAEVYGGIVVKTPKNEWHRLYYTPTEALHSIGNFLYSRDNILWAVLPRVNRGLFVLSVNGTIGDQSDDKYRSVLTKSADPDVRNQGQLQIWDENQEVITNAVFAICEDKNGQIWLGTDKGIVVYYRPSTILRDDYPVASRIKVPRNDGTNAADYLLGNEKVTCIAVDGANRKWIGTESSGLFLVSSDGLETIHSFNESNSPLYSNIITSVAVHPKSGEVFIGTDKGIISYKGDAIEPEKELSSLRIYPNPVRENFTGDIVIEGFSADSEVVITDVTGGVVYKTTSLGGRATWNGKNMNGIRVKTGVYLVLAANSEGTKGVAGKVLVIK